MEKNGTKHILARVKHPQSNGRMERFFYAFERLLNYFDDVDGAIKYYNFKRLHMSPERDGKPVTPYGAFVLKNKALKERLLNENTQSISSRGS